MEFPFGFFRLPPKYSKNIIINKKKILFKKKVLKFQLTEELKTSLIEDCNILFFKVYENLENLDGKKIKILAYFFDGKRKFPAIIQNNKKIIFNFDPEETTSFLLNEKYFKKSKPPYTYLPFHYHKIPFRFILAKILNFIRPKSRQKNPFPDWPIERSVETIKFSFLESLKKIQNKNSKKTTKQIKHFWPKNKKYALALTHDVDTGKGFRNIKKFAALEEKYSFRSTWFLVGNYYKLDKNLIEKLKEKGHEIACHGYNHDNKLSYLSREKISLRLKRSLNSLQGYDVQGFRSPSLITSSKLNEEISKFFLYDSSVPDTEKFPVDSKISGCCSIFPFMKNNFLEIPITIPMDCSLIFLGYSPDEILKIWIEKLEYIKKLGGVAVINTHPEPAFSANKQMLQTYNKFLEYIAKDKTAWITNMNDIASWWKKSIS